MSFETLPAAGRYAPSPSGDLHFGNLRTALLAWLFARWSGRKFYLRVEDVDTQRSSLESAARQQEDLQAIGLDWDGEVLRQQDRFAAYEAALARLPHYECYCSRKDIQEAARAPHAIPGQYPGTCRDLSDKEREAKRAELAAAGRVPALRLRADRDEYTVHDYQRGDYTGEVDDFILRRGGNANQHQDFAYNLAVVVDDAYQGVDQVVRGDDLLTSAPRQAYLARLLGKAAPEYVHVPLVLNSDGQRLSKRDGAVTLRQLLETASVQQVVGQLAASFGLAGARSAEEILERFDPARMGWDPVVWEPAGN